MISSVVIPLLPWDFSVYSPRLPFSARVVVGRSLLKGRALAVETLALGSLHSADKGRRSDSPEAWQQSPDLPALTSDSCGSPASSCGHAGSEGRGPSESVAARRLCFLVESWVYLECSGVQLVGGGLLLVPLPVHHSLCRRFSSPAAFAGHWEGPLPTCSELALSQRW